MKRALLILSFLCALVPLRSADGGGIRELVASIRNTDILFSGGTFGLHASANDDSPTSEVGAVGADAVPYLYEALDDKDRYVAAHVLLTCLVDRHWSVSGSAWNHLRVKDIGLATDENVTDQREAIKALWVEKRATQPASTRVR